MNNQQVINIFSYILSNLVNPAFKAALIASRNSCICKDLRRIGDSQARPHGRYCGMIFTYVSSEISFAR